MMQSWLLAQSKIRTYRAQSSRKVYLLLPDNLSRCSRLMCRHHVSGQAWPAFCRLVTNIDGQMPAILHQQKSRQKQDSTENTSACDAISLQQLRPNVSLDHKEQKYESRLRLRFHRYHLQLAFRFAVLMRKLTEASKGSTCLLTAPSVARRFSNAPSCLLSLLI